MRSLVALPLFLLLIGCDQRPTALQTMAQCKLDPKAEGPIWNEVFLQNCMEAKGFIRDDSRQENANLKCSDDVSAAKEAACYR